MTPKFKGDLSVARKVARKAPSRQLQDLNAGAPCTPRRSHLHSFRSDNQKEESNEKLFSEQNEENVFSAFSSTIPFTSHPPLPHLPPAPPRGSGSPSKSSLPVGLQFSQKSSLRSSGFTLWRAKKDLLFFYGPLGEPIGHVEEGAVVREWSRYEDPFGGVWFSTVSSDNSLVWLSFFDPEVHPMEDPGEMQWEIVLEEKVNSETAVSRKQKQYAIVEFHHPFHTSVELLSTSAGELRKSDLSCSTHSICAHWCFSQEYIADLVRGSNEFPSDILLIDYYWKEVVGVSPIKHVQKCGEKIAIDWNYRYQCALEKYFFDAVQSSKAVLSEGSRSEEEKEIFKRDKSEENRFSGSVCGNPSACHFSSTNDASEPWVTHDAYQKEIELSLKEFTEVAEETVVLLLEELVASTAKPKTFFVHPHFRHVFYLKEKNLLLQVVVDTPSGALGGNDAAAKLWRQRFRFMQMMALECTKHFLHHPLYTIVTLKGMSVVVLSIPPVTLAQVVYSSLAGAHHRLEMASSLLAPLSKESQFVLNCSDALGRALNFKEHSVCTCKVTDTTSKNQEYLSSESEGYDNEKDSWKSTLPVSTELYAGSDERLYIFCTSFSPPIPPLKGPHKIQKEHSLEMGSGMGVSMVHHPTSANDGSARSCPMHSQDTVSTTTTSESLVSLKTDFPTSEAHVIFLPSQQLFSRVRPELLRSLPQSVNPDAFIQGCYDSNDEQHLLSISEYLRGRAISAVADMVGFHRALDGVVIVPSVAFCTLCSREMTAEMRLIVCYHPARCCKICSHCYCERMSTAFNAATGHLHAGEEALTNVQFSDAVKCGYQGRRGSALRLEPSLSDIFHSQGLNLSFLPFVRNRLPLSSRPLVEHFLLAEMCGRVGAQLLNSVLASCVEARDVQTAASRFLSTFLSSHGSAAKALWSKEVGPALMKKYPALGGPFSLAYLSPELLAEVIQERTGILLTSDSFLSLRPSIKNTIQSCDAGVPSLSRSQTISSLSSSTSSSSPTSPSFVDVEAILPRTRSFFVPTVTLEESIELKKKLSASVEQLLMFWIQVGCFSGKATEMMARYPFYLQK